LHPTDTKRRETNFFKVPEINFFLDIQNNSFALCTKYNSSSKRILSFQFKCGDEIPTPLKKSAHTKKRGLSTLSFAKRNSSTVRLGDLSLNEQKKKSKFSFVIKVFETVFSWVKAFKKKAPAIAWYFQKWSDNGRFPECSC